MERDYVTVKRFSQREPGEKGRLAQGNMEVGEGQDPGCLKKKVLYNPQGLHKRRGNPHWTMGMKKKNLHVRGPVYRQVRVVKQPATEREHGQNQLE